MKKAKRNIVKPVEGFISCKGHVEVLFKYNPYEYDWIAFSRDEWENQGGE